MNKKLRYALLLSALAAVIGCAQNRVQQPPPVQPEGLAITQVGYGPGAKYVTCPLSGCTRPTPKTMVEPPSENPQVQTSASDVSTPSASQPDTAAQPVSLAERVTQATVQAEPTASEATQVDALPPRRVFIRFPLRSARLTQEAKQQLDQLVPFVKGAERILIKGRTDESGDVDTNDRLAFRRAVAVREHLRRAARSSDKPFQLLAKGACCYIARNDTEAGRAENRRAEIDFILPSQATASSTRRASGKAHSS